MTVKQAGSWRTSFRLLTGQELPNSYYWWARTKYLFCCFAYFSYFEALERQYWCYQDPTKNETEMYELTAIVKSIFPVFHIRQSELHFPSLAFPFTYFLPAVRVSHFSFSSWGAKFQFCLNWRGVLSLFREYLPVPDMSSRIKIFAYHQEI